jgi:hypothetical protein
LPVQVSDTTGSIADAAIDDRNPPIGNLGDPFLAPVPGRPDGVVVGWTGGVCDEDVGIDLSPSGEGRPVFTLKLVSGQGGCFLELIPRRVILTLEDPVDINDFALEVVR